MKRYEKYVLLLAALLILSKFTPLVRDLYLARTYGPPDLIPHHIAGTWQSISMWMVALVNAGAAVWLIAESAREAANRWIWGLFGLLFGLIGVIVFYVVLIYRTIRDERTET